MPRRPIYRRLWLAGFLVAGLAVRYEPQGLEQAAAPAPPRSNVIYIYADDLGCGELGAYGQKKIRTPHLDRLAREGMRFTQHYASSPVCAPSRAMLLTGLHGGHARETTDLAARHPDILARLDAIAAKEHRHPHVREWEFIDPKFPPASAR